MKTVLIVGTGLGGLCAALRLAKQGYRVVMVEKFQQAGGRLNQLRKEGFTFDLAPTFFSMTYEFRELMETCKMITPFEFVELDPLYTVNFAGSTRRFQIYKDIGRLAGEFDGIEPDFARKMRSFLQSSGKLFHDVEDRIIRRNFDSKLDYIMQMSKVPWGHGPKMLRTVWSELDRYFDSREVKEIFSLVAFFLGATPFDTPAVYTILSYTELVHDGYHSVRGGMYKIVESLLNELEKEGVGIHYNTEITDYIEEKGRLCAFTDQKGNRYSADHYVINAEAPWFRGKIFKRPEYSPRRLDRMKWTLAPFTIYLGVKGKIGTLDHHNYFLGNNFKEYAGKVFKNEISLKKPYYYVNVNSKFNPGSAPQGCENIFILCPVPDLRYKPDWSDREELAGNIIHDLSERIGYDLSSNIITQTIYDPVQWEKMFNLYRGSGLGLAHNLGQMGAFRPANQDEKYDNVFYVGASTIPGTGLPMVVISSRLVTERILRHDRGL